MQDKIDEPDETILIDAARVTGADTTAAVGSRLTVTIADDDAAPVLLFEVDDGDIAEAAGEATLTVRTGTGSTFAAAQTINLTLDDDGTAALTNDFTLASASLTLPAGSGTSESRIATTIAAVQDKIDEPDETILVDAARVTGADTTAAVGSRLTVTIADDDAAPVLALDVTSATISEAAGTSTVTVSTGAGSTFATEQTIALSLGGTATVSDDYTIGSTSLTLPAGMGTAASTIATTITAVDDDFFEGTTDEQITVSGSRNSTDFGSTRTVTITENEQAPKLTLTLTDADDSISENGGSTTVTATVAPRTVDALHRDRLHLPGRPRHGGRLRSVGHAELCGAVGQFHGHRHHRGQRQPRGPPRQDGEGHRHQFAGLLPRHRCGDADAHGRRRRAGAGAAGERFADRGRRRGGHRDGDHGGRLDLPGGDDGGVDTRRHGRARTRTTRSARSR